MEKQKRRPTHTGKKRGNGRGGAERKYFGSVEYLENSEGNVVEIKATNGTFNINPHPLSPAGLSTPKKAR